MLNLHRIFITSVIILYLNCQLIEGFGDDAIFEEEDIYNQALPPPEFTGLTLPGTKWCGPGDRAKNFNDLGHQIDIDKCCRTHDHCPEIIESHQQLHGLSNNDTFPRLTCKCEQEFFNCLQDVNSVMSINLGRLYFGFRSKCFHEDYPIIECTKLQGAGKLAQKRCVRYKLNKTKSKIWQYFDTPFFGTK